MNHPPPRPGRPPDAAKRRAILDATRARFLAAGFAGLSIEAVAALAQVSKVTIYKQFGDRAGLLAALVRAESDWMEAELADLSGGELTRACQRLMGFLFRRDVMDFDAQMQLGAQDHPALVARFFAAGPARLQAALTKALEGADLRSGPPEAQVACLMGLLFATQPAAVRFGLAPALPDATRDAAVAQAVQDFRLIWAKKGRA